ncbi:short-chain dehydrogenase [Devosia psychrophila]|uniref:Short-chain dehydrogenase n=1 Tax=Devosia psychrophila TaxID=728005 RepID=A0ABR5E099_9HYPH|nr:short-chain dehydrogenase [Devosia psychrophila]
MGEQTVIITGAGQGLGAAIARRFASAGARLALMDYNAAALAETTLACGASAIGIEVDLSDRVATNMAIAKTFGQLGRVDTLIHNAAILRPTPFADEDFDSFFRVVNVGLQAGFQLARAVWPGMRDNGGGALIFVSSRSGVEGFAEESAYCAAKHALEGLSKSLALEGAPFSITANTITPGMYMRTPMSARNYSEELKQKWVDPALLTPAFVLLAEQRLQPQNGHLLDAWVLSQEGA